MFLAYDLIIAAIIIATLVLGYKRGFSGSVVGLVSVVVSVVAALMISYIISPIIYDVFFAQSISDGVYQALPDSKNVDEFLLKLPDGISFLFANFTTSIAKFVENGTDTAALSIISVIKPAVTALIRVVLFLPLLLILSLIARPIFKKVLKAVFSISIIKWLDGILGLIIAIPVAILIVCLLAGALSAASEQIPISPEFFSDEIIDQTLIFKHVYSGGLTSFLLGLLA